MKVIYVAGAYRAKSEFEVLRNIRDAESLAVKIWRTGNACICPHKNTAFLGGAVPDEVWLQGAVLMVLRSDAVVCVDNWRNSEGATREVTAAEENGIPVFERFEDFELWQSQNTARA
jgi:hypothetical protein